jgi:hypothetical protein
MNKIQDNYEQKTTGELRSKNYRRIMNKNLQESYEQKTAGEL